ncbi:MAG: iron-containing alcohol dehydrogenase family protein [Lachnospiraceae bacterium]|nr:iron-containing alcohol dehydrogenase family protein [Lachnospiraceae bacterium]
MENYDIYLPSYSIGTRIYDKIPEICSAYGKTAVIIGGRTALKAAAEKIRSAAAGSGIIILEEIWYGGEASYENVELLKKNNSVAEADMLFAAGGGKALDTCKALGEQLHKPVFTFPTIASTCAATTAVSIMYYPDGSFKQPFFLEKPPVHAFIDTGIIGKAPEKYIWAGMGDTYAKYYEASVSARGDRLVHYLQLGVNVSQMCVGPVLEYGEKALADIRKGEISYELEQVILAIVVTTGIASILLTKEHTVHYNSGLAHAVFYSLTAYEQIEKKHLHGEVVAYGVLILLLCDNQREEFERLYEFHKKTSLPVKLSDMDITYEEMSRIAQDISERSDIAHYPYKVSADMVMKAVDTLENM